jgi:hypothetical protein
MTYLDVFVLCSYPMKFRSRQMAAVENDDVWKQYELGWADHNLNPLLFPALKKLRSLCWCASFFCFCILGCSLAYFVLSVY